MTDDITIPPESVEAGAKAAHDEWRRQASVGDDITQYEEWDNLSRFHKDEYREQATAAITAALKAWPGMFSTELEDHTGIYRKIVLPLPKEKQDG